MFESIVFKPEDVLTSIRIEYWEVSSTTYNSLYQFKNWHWHDSKHYGRCFTLTPSDEIIRNGIKMIALKLMANSSIFVHTPGVYNKRGRRISTKGTNDSGYSEIQGHLQKLPYICEEKQATPSKYNKSA